MGPAGTPQPIVQTLNKALADDAARKRIINEGAEPEPGTQADQAAVIEHEETKWAALIETAGLKPK